MFAITQKHFSLLKGFIVLLSLWAFLAATSCVPINRLKKGEALLFDQEIVGTQRVSESELAAFYRQKPNRKLGGMISHTFTYMPWLYVYYIGKKRYDRNIDGWREEINSLDSTYRQKTLPLQAKYDSLQASAYPNEDRSGHLKDSAKLISKIRKLKQKQNEREEKLYTKIEEGNWLMRSVGEKPVIYDPELAEITAAQMEKYLASQGHFRSKVSVAADTLGGARKKIKLTYRVTEAKAYEIRKYSFIIPDSAVRKLVMVNQRKSFVDKRRFYNEKNLDQERRRLVNLLKNRGYFDFNTNFISFEVDSTIGKQELDIWLRIDNPSKNSGHSRYYIDEILFETDVDLRNVTQKNTITFDGIQFKQESGRYSKRVLASKIYFRKDSLFRQQSIEDTQLALSQMDMFKFVNINYEKKANNRLKVNIFTSDFDKYQYSLEGGLNVTRSLPGPFVSLSLKNRNMLNIADVFEVSGRLAVEAQGDVTNTNNNYSSQEYGLNGNLSLPFIVFPISRKFKRKLGVFQPRTILQTGFNLVDRPEFRRSSVQGSAGYQWTNRKNHVFNWGIANVSILKSNVTDSFDSLLNVLSDQGSNLQLSFQNSFVSHTNFTFTKASRNYGSLSEKNTFFKAYLEVGGIFSDLWNKLLNEREGELLGLRYFRYYRFYIDYRYGIPISKNNLVATRLHLGFAQPFKQQDNTLPYEKYFFSGGSNSNRAWRARRVGPGSFSPEQNDDGSFNYQVEQPGELMLEANIEWRFKLFGFVDWAFFSDASNIWLITSDPSRPGAQFDKTKFWKEFAIGTGYGLRLDFSFLLVRFDIGTKIYNPALPEGNRFIGNDWLKNLPFGKTGQTEFNIGIGYPF